MKKVAGEVGSIAEEDIKPWLDRILPDFLSSLFYKLQPDKPLTFRGERCTDGKKAKDCLTVLVGASMAGEKLPLLVIGKSKSPSLNLHHCSFQSSTADSGGSTEVAQHDTTSILDAIRENGGHIEGGFEDFAAVDNNIENAGTLTDDDVAAMVLGNEPDPDEESSPDDHDEPVVCPTLAEYHSALDIVRRFIPAIQIMISTLPLLIV